jgi:ubiquinol-cytochrome c reductase cytochrome b subunit
LQYNPGTAYYSANSLDAVVPFGAFWRSLHFFSSQVFFLFSVIHFIVLIAQGKHRKINRSNWYLLTSSFAVLLLILFTGYVLRGDATGSFAGIIAENIILSVPILGKWINYFLFSIAESGLTRVFSNHMVGLCLIWLFMSWNHIRHYSISLYRSAEFSLLLVLFCMFVQAPMEPEKLGVFKVNGPWFFLGLQEMLKYIPPFWAGVFFPGSLIVALLYMNRGGVIERISRYYVFGWLSVYLCLSLIILL